MLGLFDKLTMRPLIEYSKPWETHQWKQPSGRLWVQQWVHLWVQQWVQLWVHLWVQQWVHLWVQQWVQRWVHLWERLSRGCTNTAVLIRCTLKNHNRKYPKHDPSLRQSTHH
jgi:hypothetical protein